MNFSNFNKTCRGLLVPLLNQAAANVSKTNLTTTMILQCRSSGLLLSLSVGSFFFVVWNLIPVDDKGGKCFCITNRLKVGKSFVTTKTLVIASLYPLVKTFAADYTKDLLPDLSAYVSLRDTFDVSPFVRHILFACEMAVVLVVLALLVVEHFQFCATCWRNEEEIPPVIRIGEEAEADRATKAEEQKLRDEQAKEHRVSLALDANGKRRQIAADADTDRATKAEEQTEKLEEKKIEIVQAFETKKLELEAAMEQNKGAITQDNETKTEEIRIYIRERMNELLRQNETNKQEVLALIEQRQQELLESDEAKTKHLDSKFDEKIDESFEATRRQFEADMNTLIDKIDVRKNELFEATDYKLGQLQQQLRRNAEEQKEQIDAHARSAATAAVDADGSRKQIAADAAAQVGGVVNQIDAHAGSAATAAAAAAGSRNHH